MIHFLSDLHLSTETPGIARLFRSYLAGPARQADAIYILGDLFEAWAGDDDLDDPFNRDICAALRALSDSGVELHVQHGNRDFLLGSDFAATTGARLLPDPYVLSLPAWQFVLTHGDLLCTDDQAYQDFRRQVRSPEWAASFLAQPLSERKAQVAAYRARSEQVKQEKTPAIMDVNAGATEDFLRDHGYATLIHGHTHRPACHDHIVDGIHCERWVLGDWHEGRDGSASQGDYLSWSYAEDDDGADRHGVQRHPLTG